jgi:hypothetical protein
MHAFKLLKQAWVRRRWPRTPAVANEPVLRAAVGSPTDERERVIARVAGAAHKDPAGVGEERIISPDVHDDGTVGADLGEHSLLALDDVQLRVAIAIPARACAHVSNEEGRQRTARKAVWPRARVRCSEAAPHQSTTVWMASLAPSLALMAQLMSLNLGGNDARAAGAQVRT